MSIKSLYISYISDKKTGGIIDYKQDYQSSKSYNTKLKDKARCKNSYKKLQRKLTVGKLL